MLTKDIFNYIIKPSLQITNLWSPSAEILIYGTGMVETGYQYLMQIGAPANGGIGFWQMEPSDYTDICRWLKAPTNRVLCNSILAACYYDALPSDPNSMASNLRFAALMCRVHYSRFSEPLPNEKDAAGMAKYHKIHYNTALGAADMTKNTDVFQGIIDGKL